MNRSITDNEWKKQNKEFPRTYINWIKNHKNNELAPIYPAELNDTDIGDDEWEYRKDDRLLLGHMEQDIKNSRINLIKRIVKSYNMNKNKINNKPEQPELSQSQQRILKLSDLNSRSSSWKGLEGFIGGRGGNSQGSTI